jgi:phospholipid transport system substrate-binding protein
MRLIISLDKIILTFFTLFLMSTSSFANTSQAMTPANPAYVIHTALNKITTFSTNSDKVNPVQLRSFIENKIIPHFDFDNMSHWITGRYARNMTDKDKADFQRSLRETFLSSLSKHLGSFDAENTRVKFYPARYRGPDEAFVSTSVYRPDTPPVRLDFRMRRSGNIWKIIDVKANGSSAVLYYRKHFMSQLRQYQRQQSRQYQGQHRRTTPTNRPANRPVNRPVNQSTNRAAGRATQQPAKQPAQQPEQKSVQQPVQKSSQTPSPSPEQSPEQPSTPPVQQI